MDKYAHIVQAVFERPWAIHPSMLSMIVDILQFRAEGGVIDSAEIQARLEAARQNNGPRTQKSADAIGVVPIYGLISPRSELFSDSSGGTSVESIRRNFRMAMKDPEVGAILLDIDSPGGNVEGVHELASEIREARGQKPITAIANYNAHSAAYWLAAAADEIVATPSGSVGSIGVIAAHQDVSAKMEKEGVKTTIITHGKYKAEGNKFEPLSEEARAEIQSRVDEMGAVFEDDLAAARGVPVKTVRDHFGAGRTFSAKTALNNGMVDAVATYDATLSRLSRSLAVSSSTAATAQAPNYLTGQVLLNGVVASVEKGYLSNSSVADLVAGLPFAERLALVAGEVEAIATHARKRAEMRAEEGRALSSETRDQLRRLLDLRAVLDDIEPLAEEPKQTRVVRNDLALLIAAYENGGYDVEEFVKRVMGE